MAWGLLSLAAALGLGAHLVWPGTCFENAEQTGCGILEEPSAHY